MITVTINFDKYEKSETKTTNNLDEESITNIETNSLPWDIKNSLKMILLIIKTIRLKK